MRHEKLSLEDENFITPDSIPDPKPLPTITGYRILVRPLSVVRKTKGGLILPDSIRHDMNLMTTVGKVLSMGSQCYNKEEFGSPWCKVGDFVCYNRLVGKGFIFKGVKLLLVRDEDILMVLLDPSDIDPSISLSVA